MMKRLFLFVFAVCVNLIAWADVWTPETLPVPQNTYDSTAVNYVSNPDGILSQAEVDRINDMFFIMERDKGVRGLVIAVEEIDPDDPYEFTITVANKHGIGGKANTGVVIMVATVSRAVSILTGNGMEKFLTDAQCSYIRRNILTPFLKEGKWGEGIQAACEKISAVVTEQEELVPDEDDEDDDLDNLMWAALLYTGIFGGVFYFHRKRHKCPKCKKTHYKIKLRQIVLAPDEEGALTQEENEAELQAKLLSMRLQKNQDMMDAVKAYQEGSMQASALTDVLSTGMTNGQDALTDIISAVTPNMAARAVMTAEQEKAFDNEKKKIKRSSLRKGFGVYRKVHIVDVYGCPDCGYEKRKEYKASSRDFELGLFTTGTLGAIASASSSGGGLYGRGSSYSGGGGHSWGSSGGGSFGGGGSSGRF